MVAPVPRSSRSSIVPIRASKGNTDKSERTSGSPAGSSGICKERGQYFALLESKKNRARQGNGELAALTSGHRAFRRHVEHAESGDPPPCLAHAESTERRAKKSSTAKLQTRQRSPAGLRRRRKRTHAIRRASAFSGCSFGGNLAGGTWPRCGRGREGPCFGV